MGAVETLGKYFLFVGENITHTGNAIIMTMFRFMIMENSDIPGAFFLFVRENITVMMKIIASIMIRMRGNMMAIIIINNYENGN